VRTGTEYQVHSNQRGKILKSSKPLRFEDHFSDLVEVDPKRGRASAFYVCGPYLKKAKKFPLKASSVSNLGHEGMLGSRLFTSSDELSQFHIVSGRNPFC